MSDPSTIVEHRDSLKRLADAGYSRLLEVLADPSCYTDAGRVVITKVARVLCVSPKRAAAMLQEARRLLGE